MNITSQSYCQLKYDSNKEYPKNPSLQNKRKKCNVYYSNQEFYVEDYNNFESLKRRINQIYNHIIEGFNKQGIDIFGNQCGFPELIVSDRHQEDLIIGISPFGWKISITFSDYLLKDFQKKYGQEEGEKKYFQLAEQKEVFFYIDSKLEPNIVSACELVSEETAYIILKEFVDNGKDEWSINPIVFEQEVEKRNY